MILAGDVGGTKSILGLYRVESDRPVLVERRSFPSRRYASLEDIIREFLGGKGTVDRVCIGVAGPVVEGKSRLTNLPWRAVEEDAVRRAAGAGKAWLINDLETLAFVVPFLGDADLDVLQEGAARAGGTIAVVAAGTGLGEGILVWTGREYQAVPTEGGHVDFAPRNEREVLLLEYLRALYGRVSVERVVSGPGLHAIYLFLRDRGGMEEDPGIAAQMTREDPPYVIVREGQGGASPICREALRILSSLFGAVAGNVALQVMATGGVYLGGGLTPAILPVLKEGEFLESFLAKGRFRDLLSTIPVKVIRDPGAALLGAARYALARG